MAWRIAMCVAWVAVIACLGVVWNTSRRLGLSTWWLGPEAQPRSVALNLLPFLGPVVVLTGVLRNTRYLAWIGVAASIGLAAIATGDLSRTARLAWLELFIAGAALLVSMASASGQLRRVRPAP